MFVLGDLSEFLVFSLLFFVLGLTEFLVGSGVCLREVRL